MRKFCKNCFNALTKIDQSARKTITFDNGFEFVNYLLLKKFLKIDTYFCDKRSPWKKGQVEKTNAMLHRFIHKKSLLTKSLYENSYKPKIMNSRSKLIHSQE
jgi:IS30 family transposase